MYVWRVCVFFRSLTLFFYIRSCDIISFHFIFPFCHRFHICQCGFMCICIHWLGFRRSLRFNRCVRPSICPELIVSQTVSIEFNLVCKIHRKKTETNGSKSEGSKRNGIRKWRGKKTATTSYTRRIKHGIERDLFTYFILIGATVLFQSFALSLSFPFFSLSIRISFIWALNLTADFSICVSHVVPYMTHIWNEKGKVEKYTHTVTRIAIWKHIHRSCSVEARKVWRRNAVGKFKAEKLHSINNRNISVAAHTHTHFNGSNVYVCLCLCMCDVRALWIRSIDMFGLAACYCWLPRRKKKTTKILCMISSNAYVSHEFTFL